MRLIFLTLFLFSSTLVWAMGQVPAQTVNNPLIGKAAPDVVLSRTDGTSAGVVASRQGKKEILVFWATWCPHCYEELGSINENMATVEQKGVKIVLVDVGETSEAVKNYFTQRQMKLVSFVDEDSFLQGVYHLAGIPTIIFINEKGIIRSVTHQFPSDYSSYFST